MGSEEAGAELDEETEGDAAVDGRGVGYDQVGEAAGGGLGGVGGVFGGGGGDVVDVVGAVGVGEFLRGGVVDFGEDEGGEGGGLGCGGGGVFR